jgi:hypothetical protein
MFYFHSTGGEEDIMKKLGFIVAAVAAMAIAAPSIASAEKIVIKRGGEHHARADKVVIKSGHREGARAEFRGGYRDRGWHRGHDRKVVVIKHGRRHFD